MISSKGKVVYFNYLEYCIDFFPCSYLLKKFSLAGRTFIFKRCITIALASICEVDGNFEFLRDPCIFQDLAG